MLNIGTSVLVIIDVQEKLVNATTNGMITAKNMAKLAKAANILKVPTIITEQYPKGLGKTVNDIELTNNTELIEKTSFSALLDAEFAEELQSLNKKQILIGGIETHICVLQTVADLISEGYEVFVLKDCCSSRKNLDNDTGLELMKQYGAKITSTEIALFEWLKTSKHESFKDIQSLIK